MPQKFYTKGGKVRPITPRINFTYRGHRNFLPLDEKGKAIVASRGILQTAHDPSTKREDKLKLKRALVSASNKALALGKNAPFGSAERAKYSDVANVYRDAYEAIRIVDIKPTKLQRGYEVSGTSVRKDTRDLKGAKVKDAKARFKRAAPKKSKTEDPFEGDDDPYGIKQEGMSDSERFGTGFSVGDEVPLSRKR